MITKHHITCLGGENVLGAYGLGAAPLNVFLSLLSPPLILRRVNMQLDAEAATHLKPWLVRTLEPMCVIEP